MIALKDRAVLTFPQMKAAAKRVKKHKDLFLEVVEIPMEYYGYLIQQKKGFSGKEYARLSELRKRSGLFQHHEFIEDSINKTRCLISNPVCYVELWGPKLGKLNAISQMVSD